MPHLRFRALDSKHVASLSIALPKSLAVVMQTSEDNFTFESITTDYFENGQSIRSYPFIEVHWFARSQQIQNQSSRIITDNVKELGAATDVVVVFYAIDKATYYENGKHF